MQEEVEDHKLHGHWETVPRLSIPSSIKTIKAIWSLKHKPYTNSSFNNTKLVFTHIGVVPGQLALATLSGLNSLTAMDGHDHPLLN